MANEVDEIRGDVVMWPLKSMRWEGCGDVAAEVNEIGRGVVMWPMKLMTLERMS